MKRDVWDKRRLRMDLALLFIAAALGYTIFIDSGSETSTTAITILGMGGVSILGSYIFGAVWDYKIYADAVKTKRSMDEEADDDSVGTTYTYKP